MERLSTGDRQSVNNGRRRAIEEKIDEFIEDTFPASDPPNWSSIQRLIRESMAQQRSPSENEFVLDIERIRERAKQHLENGAVTPGYGCELTTALKLLNDALATEIVCVLRYSLHYQMASGLSSESVAGEFLEHAREEQRHADMIAARIAQLNGEPNFDPAGLKARAKTDYVRCDNLVDMIRENLIAERIVIDIYNGMISFFGRGDPTTRRMLEHILREEEEHAEELRDLLPHDQEKYRL